MGSKDLERFQKRIKIDKFRGRNSFLSNFYPSALCIDGLTYLNAEAAFQAYKCIDPKDREQFTGLLPNEAKRLGRKVKLRPDWEDIKFSVMEQVVRAKFVQNPHLARYLVETGNAELIEGNNWKDTIWGVDFRTGAGENNLGRILMNLRKDFQQNGIPEGQDLLQIRTDTFPCGFSVRFQDISQLECECVVNDTDAHMSGKNGVDAAIHLAAGPELDKACETLHGCRLTEMKMTDGYRLPAKHIIHTVGPHYGQQGDKELLKQTYQNVLELAMQHDIHSIAFPAISIGINGFPKKLGSQIGADSVRFWKREHLYYDMEIIFATLDPKVYECLCNNLRQHTFARLLRHERMDGNGKSE